MNSNTPRRGMTLRTTIRRWVRLESDGERPPGRVELAVAHDRLEVIGEQLVAKVRSKFTAVTLVAGFALSVLMLEISSLWQMERVPRLLHWSIGLTVYSVALFVVGLIKLDALTMPKRFWDEIASEQPSPLPRRAAYYTEDDLWAIYSRMVFYWNHCFLIGVALTGAGMLALPRHSRNQEVSRGGPVGGIVSGWPA